MGETPSWAELHAMEPGLRPESSFPSGTVFNDTINAGLQRDQALEWLAGQEQPVEERFHGEPRVSLSAHGSGYVTIWVSNAATRCQWTMPSTIDEALRTACAAVIGSRKMETPPVPGARPVTLYSCCHPQGERAWLHPPEKPPEPTP